MKYNHRMRKLLLLLILSLFSAQGLAAACPDGSEPTRTVSADGGYYVYNCGNTNNEQTSSSVDISVSVDTEEALESQTLDSKRFESSIQKNGKVIFEGADQFTKFDFGIPLDNSGALLVGFKDLTWLSDKKVNVRTHIRYGNIDFSVGICFEYYSPQDFMAARTSFKKNDWGGLKNIMPSSRCIGTWELDDNKSKLEELGVYAVMDDIQLEQNTRKLLEALDEQTNGSLCFLLAKIISKENCVNITETEAVDTEEAIEKELAEFEAELEAELSEAGTSKLKVIPAKAKKTTDGVLKCKYGFYQNNNDQFSCSKLPANAVAYGSGPGFFCRTGYEKKYEIVCVKSSEPNNKADDIIVNYDAIEKELAEFEAELEAELSEAGASKLKVIPANAHASGSSFMCNNGYYKNSSTTGCLKVPVNAKKYASDKGWSCNTGYTKTGKSCENTAELEKKKLEQEKFEEEKRVAEEKIAKKRKEAQTLAQTYFNDLVAFLKTNNKEYDITTIVSLVNLNKALLTKPWNEVLEKNFAKLKVYTDSSEAFLDYHKSKNDERQKVILNELARANTKLKNIITYLKFYVQNNITSDIAQSVLDQIKVAEKGLKMQNSKELSKVSTQLESFITKNNLSTDYRTFVKSLSKTKTKTETPQVTTNNIDATYLVNVDFIKKANKSDYIALVNLTGKAPNALLNLEGRVVFENDNALSCFYQSKNTIKNDLKYYLYDKFSNNEFLVLDKGFECNQNNLFSYDLVFFEKDTLLRESKSYVSSLAAAIAYNQLQLFNTVTKEEQNKDFADRKNKVRNITEGLEDEMILGFGSLIIDNDNTTLCTDVENTLGQASIMNLWLPNKFTRMGYGKSVGNVSFNNVEGTFTNVQRGLCGFIYAGEESLANLLNAFEKSGTKYDILPIWFSKKDVNNEQLRQENRKQSALINAQKRKEQIDKDKELARLREEADLAALKASGILKAEQQKELRKRYRNVIEAHLQKIEKETALLLDKDTNNTIKEHMALVGPMLSLYPSLLGFIEDRFKESWELDKFSIEINDYGLGNYRNRMIETFITDIDFTLKNRVLGEYDRSCARVAIIDDKEFDMLREPELKIYKGACKPGSLDSYKKKLDFQSSWIVE